MQLHFINNFLSLTKKNMVLCYQYFFAHPLIFFESKTHNGVSSINTIHVKEQHNVGFFIFKFMLGNVHIDEIHARQCLYIISLYWRKGLSHAFNFFVVSKGIRHV